MPRLQFYHGTAPGLESPSNEGVAGRAAVVMPAARRPDLAAGSRLDYLIKSLTEYRDGSRSGIDTSMNGVMYQVLDRDIRALAHYLGSLR